MTSRKIDTGTPDLLAELEGQVLTITLHRPDSRNALSRPMLQALEQQLAAAEFDDEVRCIVLTGAGKGFCAGGDVKGMAARGADGDNAGEPIDAQIHRQRHSQRATAGKLFTIPKPTIAAINGAAAGAGFALALSCDLRIMSSDAFMTTAFAKVGYPGDYGGTYFLTKLVGAAKARELFLLSDRIDADEALRLGLTNWICAPQAFDAHVKQLATRLAVGPSIAYRYMKENLNRAMSGELNDCLDLEATHQLHCSQTEDHREAARAFVEKRTPVFTGR